MQLFNKTQIDSGGIFHQFHRLRHDLFNCLHFIDVKLMQYSTKLCFVITMKVILIAFISLRIKKNNHKTVGIIIVLAKWSNVRLPHSNVVLNMLSFMGQKSLQSK